MKPIHKGKQAIRCGVASGMALTVLVLTGCSSSVFKKRDKVNTETVKQDNSSHFSSFSFLTDKRLKVHYKESTPSGSKTEFVLGEETKQNPDAIKAVTEQLSEVYRQYLMTLGGPASALLAPNATVTSKDIEDAIHHVETKGGDTTELRNLLELARRQ